MYVKVSIQVIMYILTYNNDIIHLSNLNVFHVHLTVLLNRCTVNRHHFCYRSFSINVKNFTFRKQLTELSPPNFNIFTYKNISVNDGYEIFVQRFENQCKLYGFKIKEL